MIKKIIVAALVAAGLGACHSMDHHGGALHINPEAPRVNVIGGIIVVDQEPIVFTRDKVNVHIVWRLPHGGEYTFNPKMGIQIEREGTGEIVDCRPAENGYKFQCLNRHTKPGRYKYTINVLKGATPLTLDPQVVNL